jgi:hypothetical protein
LLVLTLSAISPAVANIQNVSTASVQKSSSRSHSKSAPPMPPLRILAPGGGVEVMRGGSVDIPIVMPPRMGAGLDLIIKRPPAYGDLIRLTSEPGAPICYRYLHRRVSSEAEDSFSILVRDPLASNSGNLVSVTLIIRNPPADIIVDPEGLVDFGKAPLGCPVTRDVMIQNRYGATIDGNLLVDPPWRVDGDLGIRLAEGDSRQVHLIFDPQVTGSQSTSLRIDGVLANFPQIILRGEGTAPFVIQERKIIRLSEESPQESLILKNSLAKPVSVNFSGIPPMVRGEHHIELPPFGSGTVTLSITGTGFEPDYLDKFRIAATTGAFREVVDLEIIGPKAPPTLELLRGGDVLTGTVGTSLRLEGIARNPSDDRRTLELRIFEGGEGKHSSVSTLDLPPKGIANFHKDWTPDVVGNREIAVELIEKGRILERQSWHVATGLPSPPSCPAGLSAQHHGLSTATPGFYEAPQKISEQLVVGLRSEIRPGWFFDHVLLTWSYFGTDRPAFRVLTQSSPPSVISNRTGEQSEEKWIDVEGIGPIQKLNGRWSVQLPFLFPGCYSFSVVPDIKGVDKLPNIPPIQITCWMAYWKLLRALLVFMLLLLVLRNRHRL